MGIIPSPHSQKKLLIQPMSRTFHGQSQYIPKLWKTMLVVYDSAGLEV